MRFLTQAVVMLCLPAVTCPGELSVEKIGDSVVDEKALTIKGSFGQSINGVSFQQEAVLTHGGRQYVGYYDANRRVCIARRRLPDGDWNIVRFDDYDFQSNDAHNVISIGICPADGTIHLAFDHHVHPLHYRMSEKGAADRTKWNPDLFGPVRSYMEEGKEIRVTYPRFFQTPDGGLQFCYRRGGSGNGDRMLVDYNSATGKWTGTRQIDSRAGKFTDYMGTSSSRCSYPNGYNYGPEGRLHVTWVWRESSQGSNHDLMYCYSEDGGHNWRNNTGELLEGPARVDSPGIKVVAISRAYGLMNTHGQTVDSTGRVHVVMRHCSAESLAATGSKPGEHRWGPAEARRYHHYWRGRDGKWHHTEMPWIAGNRPKIFTDDSDDAYLIFGARTSGQAPADGHQYTRGDLVIAAASAPTGWTDWRIIHVEKGPFGNEMLGDPRRWKQQGILSVMVQLSPTKPHQPTPLRILDFRVD